MTVELKNTDSGSQGMNVLEFWEETEVPMEKAHRHQENHAKKIKTH